MLDLYLDLQNTISKFSLKRNSKTNYFQFDNFPLAHLPQNR